jgi:hypothetical protein
LLSSCLPCPSFVLAVMRLVREMTAVPRFSTHHAFAPPAHPVSFSAIATSARPCIGANGKRSENPVRRIRPLLPVRRTESYRRSRAPSRIR